jgi:hypothetical protein
VLGGAVVRHQVHDHPDAVPAGGRHQRVEDGERAEPRVHVAVVAHVIAAVGQRGRVERGQPDGVHAESGQVGEAADQPVQVADPVAVAVCEAARVDLIYDCVRPPEIVVAVHGRHLSL